MRTHARPCIPKRVPKRERERGRERGEREGEKGRERERERERKEREIPKWVPKWAAGERGRAGALGASLRTPPSPARPRPLACSPPVLCLLLPKAGGPGPHRGE